MKYIYIYIYINLNHYIKFIEHMEIIKKIFMSLREDIKTKMKLAKSIEILKQIDKTKSNIYIYIYVYMILLLQ